MLKIGNLFVNGELKTSTYLDAEQRKEINREEFLVDKKLRSTISNYALVQNLSSKSRLLHSLQINPVARLLQMVLFTCSRNFMTKQTCHVVVIRGEDTSPPVRKHSRHNY